MSRCSYSKLSCGSRVVSGDNLGKDSVGVIMTCDTTY